MDVEWLIDFLYDKPWLPLGTGIVIILAALTAIRRLLAGDDEVWVDDVPNKVSLYQFYRGPYAPSLSPYCLKLETYLRMANIPYKNVFCLKKSSKGKMPWIRYNGVSVADSQLCMEFLNKKFDVDLNSRLKETDKAVARAFTKLLEDSLIWYVPLERFVYNEDKPWLREAGVPRVMVWLIRRNARKAAYYQGMGRHTREELHDIMSKDIQAISAYLGDKKFLMGSEPSEVDCAAFGLITQLTLNLHGSGADILIRGRISTALLSGAALPKRLAEDTQQAPSPSHIILTPGQPVAALTPIAEEKHPHLLDYCDRMRRRYWPDWEECITDGGKRKATK